MPRAETFSKFEELEAPKAQAFSTFEMPRAPKAESFMNFEFASVTPTLFPIKYFSIPQGCDSCLSLSHDYTKNTVFLQKN